jgi:hypothetical protein
MGGVGGTRGRILRAREAEWELGTFATDKYRSSSGFHRIRHMKLKTLEFSPEFDCNPRISPETAAGAF